MDKRISKERLELLKIFETCTEAMYGDCKTPKELSEEDRDIFLDAVNKTVDMSVTDTYIFQLACYRFAPELFYKIIVKGELHTVRCYINMFKHSNFVKNLLTKNENGHN